MNYLLSFKFFSSRISNFFPRFSSIFFWEWNRFESICQTTVFHSLRGTVIISIDSPTHHEFQIAREGFRNGHWKSLSLPLLGLISKLVRYSLGMKTRTNLNILAVFIIGSTRLDSFSHWIGSIWTNKVLCIWYATKSLISIKGKEGIHGKITVDKGDNSCYIRGSLVLLSIPSNHSVIDMQKHLRRRDWHSKDIDLMLPYALCLHLRMQLLSSISIFISSSSPDGLPLPIRPISLRTSSSLLSSLPLIDQSISEWTLLLRRSFDGDDHSIDLIANEHFAISLIAYGIRCLVGKPITAWVAH